MAAPMIPPNMALMATIRERSVDCASSGRRSSIEANRNAPILPPTYAPTAARVSKLSPLNILETNVERSGESIDMVLNGNEW